MEQVMTLLWVLTPEPQGAGCLRAGSMQASASLMLQPRSCRGRTELAMLCPTHSPCVMGSWQP